EIKQFIIGEDEEYGYFNIKESNCEVCKQKTGKLAYGYEIYLCGQSCFDIFRNMTKEKNAKLYNLRKEKEKVWHVIQIKQLLELNYSPDEIVERVDCLPNEIYDMIEEINNGEV
ncbi:hypothetical protein U8V72_17705, partial [Priestia filamentosa]|uniref:hypothetical protein n=1 Tax=Priestia filamentosa TaxID=1402861 RepID=UPI00397A50A6